MELKIVEETTILKESIMKIDVYLESYKHLFKFLENFGRLIFPNIKLENCEKANLILNIYFGDCIIID